MKLNISENTKKLIYCLLGICVIFAAYFFVFQKFRQENVQLKQQKTILQTELEQLDEIAANQEEYQTKIAENEKKLKEYYEEFPVLVQARDQILYASELESKYDSMFISRINMAEAEYITGTEGDAMALYRVATDMECNINYEQLKDFLTTTTADGTRKAVDELVLTMDAETGLLFGQINMNLYYMTGTQQMYKPEPIKDVTIGIQNIFQRSGAVAPQQEQVQQEQAQQEQAQQEQAQQEQVQEEQPQE